MMTGSDRLYYRVEELNGSDASFLDEELRVPCVKEEANLVGSLCEDGMHRPVIDIDLPCRLVPSSTPGHFHLYLELPMSEERFLALMAALGTAGVVSSFYSKAVQARRQAFVRCEWVKKPVKEEVRDESLART
jgi:hypothetical protein